MFEKAMSTDDIPPPKLLKFTRPVQIEKPRKRSARPDLVPTAAFVDKLQWYTLTFPDSMKVFENFIDETHEKWEPAPSLRLVSADHPLPQRWGAVGLAGKVGWLIQNWPEGAGYYEQFLDRLRVMYEEQS